MSRYQTAKRAHCHWQSQEQRDGTMKRTSTLTRRPRAFGKEERCASVSSQVIIPSRDKQACYCHIGSTYYYFWSNYTLLSVFACARVQVWDAELWVVDMCLTGSSHPMSHFSRGLGIVAVSVTNFTPQKKCAIRPIIVAAACYRTMAPVFLGLWRGSLWSSAPGTTAAQQLV